MYEICVQQGNARSTCTNRVSAACARDPFFKHDTNAVSDISDTCLTFKR
jgi:hypothetical protein